MQLSRLLLALVATGNLFAQTRPPEIPESLVTVRAAVKAGDFENATSTLKELAEAGSADAAFALGECHATGAGVKISAADAIRWYEKAADDENAAALFRMGEILMAGGEGVERDEDRGRFYLESAAEAGVAGAWGALGKLSEAAGREADAEPDQRKHFGEARRQYKNGAEGGDMESQLFYARLLAGKLGGEADLAESMKWLRKSAMGGNPVAMNDLGQRFRDGEGVEVDPIASIGWLLAGAERGSVEAMTNLGLCYANGIGVPPNPDGAGSWYAKASRRGYAPAQYLIGGLFEDGRGTKKNPVFAYVNYSRAAATGLAPAVKARDELKAKLSPEELAEAEKVLGEMEKEAK